MSLNYITGRDLVRGIKAGCINLEHNRDSVDLLNVFPVPDGDTGTNMFLTLMSAVKEAEKNQNQSLGKVARAISMGSLMGARGNSGVILSQIFRGMARILEGKDQAGAIDLAMALKAGSDTAYEAVMKPVEGTILTVIREVARACEVEARKNDDIVVVLLSGVKVGYQTLEKTPSMLPTLKEAGVVDAGGQGLLFLLEGFLRGLAEENAIELELYREQMPSQTWEKVEAQDRLKLDFQYCTEVLVKGMDLDVEDMRDHLGPLGDSMLVVGDDEIVKVHIHSNHPGKILETCLQWGQLSDIKINNMLEEAHEHLNNWEAEKVETSKKIGIIAVASGEGVAEILHSLGVDIVVEGGQTMNPSTEDLLNACNSVPAEAIIIFPNNGNIIMTAQQVIQLCDKQVVVVPTRSVMQSVTALIAYDPEGDIEQISAEMTGQIEDVQYAEVTYAVRDSAFNGLDIKTGDIIGILNGKISVAGNDVDKVLLDLLEMMEAEKHELITVFYGADVDKEQAHQLQEKVLEAYGDCEVEVHYGGQPHYSYLLSVE